MTTPMVDLCKISPVKPPDGVYRFDHPKETLTPLVLSLGIILLTLSTILAAGKLYQNRRKLRVSDYIVLTGWFFNTGFTIDILLQSNYARHLWDIPICWYTPSYFKILFVQAFLFAPAYFFSKASILFLYRELFGTLRSTRIAINVGLIACFLIYIPNLALSAVFEAPSAGQSWSSLLTDRKSNKLTIFGLVQSSVTIVLDVYIFVLPTPIIARLNMPMAKRVQLIALFTTGVAGLVASIASLILRVELNTAPDVSWIQIKVALLSFVETNLAIIISSVPVCAQLIKVRIGDGLSWFWRLSGRSRHTTPVAGSDGTKPKIVTFGAAPIRQWQNYYEMTDSGGIETQITAEGESLKGAHKVKEGVVRQTGFDQHF
ncbi:hypothetical protein GGR57DRAFT_513119 [Xylariaceae sp. FL1272]|nr:hypothetical protein GGR57DRAFT_513119 [Xylariaceae sp. FL1272]